MRGNQAALKTCMQMQGLWNFVSLRVGARQLVQWCMQNDRLFERNNCLKLIVKRPDKKFD